MTKYDVVGVGYPSLDYSIKLNHEPTFGQTSLVENKNALSPFYGGCAVNINSILGSLGNKTALSMTVGKNFESTGYKDFLESVGVSLEFTEVDENYDTSYTFLVMAPNGEHMTFFHPGPMTAENFEPTNYTSLDAKYGLLTIGEINANKQFLDECIKREIPLIFSMKGDYSSLDEEYLLKAFNHSELIFMNASEYKQLNEYLPQKVLDYLDNGRLKAIIVTDGSRGSTVYTKDEKIEAPAYTKAKVVDTAGGGDAYIAGFVDAYLDHQSYLECALSGTAVSSYIIEEFGCLTNIPSRVQVEKRVNELKGEMNE